MLLENILAIIGFLIEFEIVLVIPVLLMVAFTTLIERKVMASMQRRVGPNVVGFMGLLQPIADGVKLFFKEKSMTQKATAILFFLAPIIVFGLALYIWFFCPIAAFSASDFELALLYILVVGVLEIYGIVLAGWASNSKYALLGGLRSTAQMISYEIALSFIFLAVILLSGTFNLTELVLFQINSGWLIGPLAPLAIVFLISMLAETNRTPFDLPEAEAELVAGYNVEYSSMLFAFFFLGEYANMLFLSAIFVVLFLGGWDLGFGLLLTHPFIAGLCFGLKTMCFLFFFIWVRATLPRYRYDQLMDLGWKVFLPFTFSYFVFLLVFCHQAAAIPQQVDFFFLYSQGSVLFN